MTLSTFCRIKVASGNLRLLLETDEEGILIFSNFQEADVVIGHADYTSDVYSLAAANNFNALYGSPVVYNDILYLPDSDFNW